MKVKEFLSLYEQDAQVQQAVEHIRARPGVHVQLKGLAGSMDAVVASEAPAEPTRPPTVTLFPFRSTTPRPDTGTT